MKHYLLWAIVVMENTWIAAKVPAANLTITPTVVGRFDDAFAPLAFDVSAEGRILAGPGIYQVDFNFLIDGLTANERGFANSLFDINLTGGLHDMLGWNSLATGAGWDGSLPPNGSTYIVNTDAGTNTSDLHRIIASIAMHLDASDPRGMLGQNGQSQLGSIFVQWDGATYSALSTNDITFSLVDGQGNFVLVPGTAAGSVIEFGTPIDNASRVLPEPAFTPPPPPPAVIAPIEVQPTFPVPPLVTPPVVINEPEPLPQPPKSPQAEVPSDGPSVWVPRPTETIDEISIVAPEIPILMPQPIFGGPMPWIDWPYYSTIDFVGDVPPPLSELRNFDGPGWIVDNSLVIPQMLGFLTDSQVHALSDASFIQSTSYDGNANPTPEPSSAALMAVAFAAFFHVTRLRRVSQK